MGSQWRIDTGGSPTVESYPKRAHLYLNGHTGERREVRRGRQASAGPRPRPLRPLSPEPPRRRAAADLSNRDLRRLAAELGAIALGYTNLLPASAPVTAVDGAGHYIEEYAPPEIVVAMRDWSETLRP